MVFQHPDMTIAVEGLGAHRAVVPGDDVVDQLVQLHGEEGVVQRTDEIVGGQGLGRVRVADIDADLADLRRRVGHGNRGIADILARDADDGVLIVVAGIGPFDPRPLPLDVIGHIGQHVPGDVRRRPPIEQKLGVIRRRAAIGEELKHRT